MAMPMSANEDAMPAPIATGEQPSPEVTEIHRAVFLELWLQPQPRLAASVTASQAL
jgi:hypothetical protein